MPINNLEEKKKAASDNLQAGLNQALKASRDLDELDSVVSPELIEIHSKMKESLALFEEYKARK